MSNTDRVKERLGIVDLVSSYIKLEKAGSNLRARCPFHNEKTPSFMVSPDRNTFKCFGCGAGGDIFTFVEEIEGVSFRDALAHLAERAGVTLDDNDKEASSKVRLYRKILESAVEFYVSAVGRSDTAKGYLDARGVIKDSREEFAVGFAPNEWQALTNHLVTLGYKGVDIEAAGLAIKGDRGHYDRFRNRIMFPISDHVGNMVGFTGRIMPGDKAADKVGKYINTPETELYHKSKVFYGLDKAKQAIRAEDTTVLVEGQLDVIMSHQAGVKNTIAVSGTALTNDHVRIMQRLSDNLNVVLDSDEAGFKAAHKAVSATLAAGMYVNVVALPPGEDPASLIQKDEAAWKAQVAKAEPFTDYALRYAKTLGLEKRKLNKVFAEFIYPYLAVMHNEIEKDEALQKLAETFDVNLDSAREDYAKWHAGSVPELGLNKPVDDKEEQDTLTKTRGQLVAKQLLGLLFASDSLENGTGMDVVKISEGFKHVAGMSPNEYLEKAKLSKDDLIFESQRLYPGLSGDALYALADELLSSLEALKLERSAEKLKSQIDSAERAGVGGLDKLMEEYQDITRSLHKLKN